MLDGPLSNGVYVGNSSSVGFFGSHGEPLALLPVGQGRDWPRPLGPRRMPACPELSRAQQGAEHRCAQACSCACRRTERNERAAALGSTEHGARRSWRAGKTHERAARTGRTGDDLADHGGLTGSAKDEADEAADEHDNCGSRGERVRARHALRAHDGRATASLQPGRSQVEQGAAPGARRVARDGGAAEARAQSQRGPVAFKVLRAGQGHAPAMSMNISELVSCTSN